MAGRGGGRAFVEDGHAGVVLALLAQAALVAVHHGAPVELALRPGLYPPRRAAAGRAVRQCGLAVLARFVQGGLCGRGDDQRERAHSARTAGLGGAADGLAGGCGGRIGVAAGEGADELARDVRRLEEVGLAMEELEDLRAQREWAQGIVSVAGEEITSERKCIKVKHQTKKHTPSRSGDSLAGRVPQKWKIELRRTFPVACLAQLQDLLRRTLLSTC